MPINASYEYLNAEKVYLNAQTLGEKIKCLEEMIRVAPKHKSSENLLAELRTRLKKLLEKVEKAKKTRKGKKGIRKEGFQFVLVGKANSGKSLLLSKLTNAEAKVSEFPFGTKEPEIGTFDFQGVKAQIVDMASIGSEYFDIGLVNTADGLLIVVNWLEEFEEIEKIISRSKGKKLVVLNKIDRLSNEGLRKAEATLKSRKINGVVVSALTGQGIEELKKKMFREMGVIRIFMKEPGKPKSEMPLVLKEGATLKDVAENILKGFSATVREARLTGPSGKFPNQRVGLDHVVKDLDVVEFHTR